jgi:hypothetical protein
MKTIVAFFRFWYDFIVGDDWTVAVTVAAAVGTTYVLAHQNMVAWWILPAAVVSTLTISVLRAKHSVRRKVT